VISLAVAVIVAGFPGVLAEHNFQTPSRNIVCNAGHVASGGRALACVVLSESDNRGQHVRWMRPTGPAHANWVIGNAATDVGALAYGKTWAWSGFRCTSRRTGLTCTNTSRHGFFLSRDRQKIF